MTGTEFRFDPDDRADWDRTQRNLRMMAQRVRDVSPAWQVLITWFSEQNFEQWLTRGTRYRTPWPPLAASTIEGKLRAGHPLDPLIRTGALVQSLSSRPLGREHVTPHEMSAGTDVRYAVFHQRGTSAMPRRALFDPAQIRREQVATTAVASWILRGEPKVGGRTTLRGAR